MNKPKIQKYDFIFYDEGYCVHPKVNVASSKSLLYQNGWKVCEFSEIVIYIWADMVYVQWKNLEFKFCDIWIEFNEKRFTKRMQTFASKYFFWLKYLFHMSALISLYRFFFQNVLFIQEPLNTWPNFVRRKIWKLCRW